MNKNYVPINKQSKKAQKEYNSKKRITWGAVNPAARYFKDDRKFNKSSRSKAKAELRKRKEPEAENVNGSFSIFRFSLKADRFSFLFLFPAKPDILWL